MINKIKELLDKSYTQYHVVDNIKEILVENNYIELYENSDFDLKNGKNYFITRSNSSIIAFQMPEKIESINIMASHTDSPTLKLKTEHIIDNYNLYKLNTEIYGGGITQTYLDRPLSVAGRIVVKNKNNLEVKNINIDKDLLIIPNMPPHLINNHLGREITATKDLVPIMSNKSETIKQIIAKNENLKEEDIIDYDLYLYLREKATFIGHNDELIGSKKLDDLACVYTTLLGFLKSKNKNSLNIYVSFDNEEVGSSTMQGAGSDFLKRVLNSIIKDEEERRKALSNAIMISADNAHATHPTYTSHFCENNRVYLNKGIVLKYSGQAKYITDAISASLVKQIAKENNLNVQTYANNSDLKGGSTLGHILMNQLSITGADIGLAQLAMHSIYEVCAVNDLKDLIKFSTSFYNKTYKFDNSKKTLLIIA